jgi:hypothetical protein
MILCNPRSNAIETGVLECWSHGVMGLEDNTPILLYSNTPISITRLASEFFLSSLKTESVGTLLNTTR